MRMQWLKKLFLVCGVLLSVSALAAETADPLPSWNEGPSKKAIIAFVTKVTTPGAVDYVAPAERIATFDNDGTLWSEQPMYTQLFFALDRVKQLAPQHPEWKTREPFSSVLKGDVKGALAQGDKAIAALMIASHAGNTTEQFRQIAQDWFETARHPVTKRLYTDMVYQPMLELMVYLRANGFKTYIVTGGGMDLVRAFAEKTYGIPPEQVIGSTLKTQWKMTDSAPVIMRLPEIGLVDDKEGKPLDINLFIGRRPLMAFGNSDGDLQMLQWATLGKTVPGFALIVHHTDAQREWAYDRKSPIGTLDKALDEAVKQGWTVVDMKAEWKTIFPAVGQ